MSEITSIEPQKRDKQRCNVYVDGKFYCGIKLEVAVKYRLKAGIQIEKRELDEIQLATEKSQAMDKALTHLSASLKTESDMRSFLAKKGYTEGVIDYVVGRLEELGLVDDAAYCRAYVQSVKGKGRRALEADLYRRGAKKSAIEAALESYEENADEAAALLEKYMCGKTCDRETLYKAFKYLLAHGYGYDTAKAALENFGEIGETDNEDSDA